MAETGGCGPTHTFFRVNPSLRRSRVLLALPGLKSLDGRPITEEERCAAPASIAAEEATMAVLLRNACEVHKMVRLPVGWRSQPLTYRAPTPGHRGQS